MLEEHPLISSLEAKINDLHRDRSTAIKIVDNNSNLLTVNTAIEEYIILKQDLIIPLGIRYLALSCIAAQYQLYQDNREISQLKDLTGKVIDIPTKAEVLNAIKVVKSKYYHIYDCDNHEFDRLKRLIETMPPNSIPEPGYPTGEEITNIVDGERVEIFRPLSIVIAMSLFGSAIGILLAMKQQPPLVIANTPQSSTVTPSNIPSSPAVIATSLPVNAVVPSPSPVVTPDPQISQDEAVSLIQKWLEAKKTLFAPPFDRESAASLLTGKAYTDKVKGVSSDGTPTSASEWLEKKHYYRRYGLQRIDGIERFEVSGDNAIIDVRITEQSNLYNPKGQLQKRQSWLVSKTIRHVLVKKDKKIKISDYNDLNTSERK